MAEEQRTDRADSASAVAQEQTSEPGDRLVRIGGVIAAVGVVASLFALLPLISDGVEAASWLWFVAIFGVGVGFGMALWGMVRAARARSRYFAGSE